MKWRYTLRKGLISRRKYVNGKIENICAIKETLDCLPSLIEAATMNYDRRFEKNKEIGMHYNELSMLHGQREKQQTKLLKELVKSPLTLLPSCYHKKSPDFIEKSLRSAKVDVDTVDEEGNSFMHYAARKNHLEVAAVLVKRGINVRLRNNYQQTFIDFANLYDLVLMPSDDEYEPALMENNTEPEMGKFYLRIVNDELEYTVLNPRGEKITDKIEKDTIKRILTQEEFAQLTAFESEKLKAFLPKILNITSKKGHTQPNITKRLEERKFYVHMTKNGLGYTVLNLEGERVIGEIKKEELEKVLTKEEFAQLNDFELKKLEPFFWKILGITSQKGHTHSRIHEISEFMKELKELVVKSDQFFKGVGNQLTRYSEIRERRLNSWFYSWWYGEYLEKRGEELDKYWQEYNFWSVSGAGAKQLSGAILDHSKNSNTGPFRLGKLHPPLRRMAEKLGRAAYDPRMTDFIYNSLLLRRFKKSVDQNNPQYKQREQEVYDLRQKVEVLEVEKQKEIKRNREEINKNQELKERLNQKDEEVKHLQEELKETKEELKKTQEKGERTEEELKETKEELKKTQEESQKFKEETNQKFNMLFQLMQGKGILLEDSGTRSGEEESEVDTSQSSVPNTPIGASTFFSPKTSSRQVSKTRKSEANNNNESKGEAFSLPEWQFAPELEEPEEKTGMDLNH